VGKLSREAESRSPDCDVSLAIIRLSRPLALCQTCMLRWPGPQGRLELLLNTALVAYKIRKLRDCQRGAVLPDKSNNAALLRGCVRMCR